MKLALIHTHETRVCLKQKRVCNCNLNAGCFCVALVCQNQTRFSGHHPLLGSLFSSSPPPFTRQAAAAGNYRGRQWIAPFCGEVRGRGWWVVVAGTDRSVSLDHFLHFAAHCSCCIMLMCCHVANYNARSSTSALLLSRGECVTNSDESMSTRERERERPIHSIKGVTDYAWRAILFCLSLSLFSVISSGRDT